ncbi:MAG: hypothetical protein EPO20_18010 [Betaproteobacteria bacterium]|nr:MAG: hypothetical protein EPO20_18010 [Betaproteobacteria bacterium]
MLVTLGFGAAVAALTSSVPFLISLSEQKEWIFLGSGAVLLLAAWLVHRPGPACPSGPGEKPDVDRIKKTITDSGFTPGKAIVRTEETR